MIIRGNQLLKVGDSAVFHHTDEQNFPYIGFIDSMWQIGTDMRVKVCWYYHPEEVKYQAPCGGSIEDIDLEGGLFLSNHSDENDVQTISHKCEIEKFEEFRKMKSNNCYYLAGKYFPSDDLIVLQKEVLHNKNQW